MAISEYLDFVIEADDFERAEDGTARFRVQVSSSPAGKSAPERRFISRHLDRYLNALRRRRMGLGGIIDLGERLANLLLSDRERRLFSDSLQGLAPHQGLRLRLHLPPGLAYIPWEYMYMKPEGSRKDIGGFLALDKQVSIMRHEVSAPASESDIVLQTCHLLVVTAAPSEPGWPILDLSRERVEIEAALRDVPGIELDFLENPSIQRLSDNLLRGADVFHFAGHGEFRTEMAERFGTFEGEGQIVLISEDGRPEAMAARRLAVTLRGNGIQLAVINSHGSGQRDMYHASSGLAGALVQARIPAVVALQGGMQDSSAIAFCRSLYRVLAAGLPLDRAVAEGRQAIHNCNSEDDPDWGVPVLYLQARNLALQTPSGAPGGADQVDRSALRRAMVKLLKLEDLAVLCADVEQDLEKAGINLQVSLAVVGGTNMQSQVLNLIQYLEVRGHLGYLVHRLQQDYSWVMDEYGTLL